MTQEREFSDRLSATLALDEPTTSITGVREARAKSLSSIGMNTVRDVLTHFPIRYMDLTKVRTSATAQIGEQCTMAGVVHEVRLKRPKPKLPIVEITLTDGDGTFIVSVFNRAYLADQITRGTKLIVAGKTEFGYGFLRMTNPYIETYDGGDVQGKIIPVHHASAKISTAHIRNIIKSAIMSATGAMDVLPADLRARRGLISRQNAFRNIHFPKTMDEINIARTRFAYEELLVLQLFMMMETNARSISADAHVHVIDGPKLERLYTSLPFELTDEQKKAVGDMLASLSADKVTSRMLLGDVGTGKTIVSAFGMASAADSGFQSMMLAPTEILAQQHHSRLGPLLDEADITHALLTGSTLPEDRENILMRFASGDIDVLIGTHALLEPDVVGKDVSFVVIDEQQRFGVGQRETLLSKGDGADSLFMTATPIPRTLALTLFGGMELSYIHKRPNKFSTRTTKVLEYRQRGTAFDAAAAALKEGRQVYIVCPLIGSDEEDSDDADERKDVPEEEFEFDDILIEDDDDFEKSSLTAANQEAETLQKQVFVGYNVGLLHGNLSPEEKASVMQKFRDGEIDVLVSTTVIEVGVDVPNATVMIIEDADRFGLSQLHQLRGRVGRGEHDGHVFLISASKHPKALRRLQALEASDDGFEIAQYDLSLRREGDILGNKQSGTSSLKIVNVVRDSALVQAAHEDAIAILEEDPLLESKKYAGLAREVRMAFSGEHSRHGG